MRYSEVYLKAAELVDSNFSEFSGWWSAHHVPLCAALSRVELGGWRAVQPAHEVFMKGRQDVPFWFGSPFPKEYKGNGHFVESSEEELNARKEHRVFALLLMAELAKDQGL